ncbi:MAG: YiiG family protein [Clostridiales bacterium]|jgi:hypothetical protein|nr:YiiG family protein [Clostridiales bacterium]
MFSGCSSISNISNGIESALDLSGGEEAEVNKHNAYIDLYNTLINDIDLVVFDYVEALGEDGEVYIEEGFDGISLYSNNIQKNLLSAMPYIDKEPAEPDADAALKDMEPILSKYAKALDEAKKYYAEKSYVDDNFEKAQQYHDVIIGDYVAVWEKIGVFLAAIDVMLEGQDEEQLASYQENGEMVHYWSLKSLIAAQEMDSYLYAQGISAENIQDISLDEFRPLYDAFVEAYKGYSDLVGDDDDAGDDEGIITLSRYSDLLSSIKSDSAELVNMLQTGGEFSETDIKIASVVSGTPEKLSKSVNDLLNAYNSWIV